MRKNAAFIHIATMNDYVNITNEIMTEINKVSFKDMFENIFINIVGDGPLDIQSNENIIVTREGTIRDYEYPTLKKLYDFCCDNNEFNVLYFHSKSVSLPPVVRGQRYVPHYRRYLWFQYAKFFYLQKHKRFIDELNNTDINVCSTDYTEWPRRHFSGNFWFAKSEYIKTLPNIDREFANLPNPIEPRNNAEFWIGYGDLKHKSFYKPDIHFYDKDFDLSILNTLEF